MFAAMRHPGRAGMQAAFTWAKRGYFAAPKSAPTGLPALALLLEHWRAVEC
jgi:hypothetical protein